MLLREVKSYLTWTTLKLFSSTFRVSWAFSLRSSSWRISDTNSSQSEEKGKQSQHGVHDGFFRRHRLWRIQTLLMVLFLTHIYYMNMLIMFVRDRGLIICLNNPCSSICHPKVWYIYKYHEFWVQNSKLKSDPHVFGFDPGFSFTGLCTHH